MPHNSPKSHRHRAKRAHEKHSKHSNKVKSICSKYLHKDSSSGSSSSRSSSSDSSRGSRHSRKSRSRSKHQRDDRKRQEDYHNNNRGRDGYRRRKRMTSAERREEEERTRQARLAKARMLAIVEGEDVDPKEEEKGNNSKKEKVSEWKEEIQVASQNKDNEIKNKDILIIPPNGQKVKEIVDIVVQLSKGMGVFEKMNEIDKSTRMEVDNPKQNNKEEQMASLAADTKPTIVNVSAPLEFVPEATSSLPEVKGEKKEEIQRSKDNEEMAKPSKKGKLEENEIDPLDAYMQNIAREKYHITYIDINDIGKPPLREAKVITLEEIAKMNQEEAKEAEVESDKDFINQLKQLTKTIEIEEEEEEKEEEVYQEQEKNKVIYKEEKKIEKKENNESVNVKDNDKGIRIYNDDDDAYMLELEKDYADDDFLSRQKRAADKKELKPINHDEMEYEPFRKNFYIEVPEISRMNEKEVKALRKQLGRIAVRGQNCPKPIKSWFQCGLADKILKVIEKKGFKDLFPIQAQTIPAAMSGRDIIAIAETGSGKTLAYVLPMLRHVLDQRLSTEEEGPIALVMAPTRELTTQLFLDIKSFTKVLGLRCACIYGGAGVAGQLSELKRGCEIVVCTPGRMIDVLTTSNGKITNLKRVTYVVLDEADRMLDMGFEPQISKILANIRPDRQTLMCSATFPRQIENLAKKILATPIEIVVGNRGQACRNVEQHIEVREESTKFHRLLEILGEWNRKGSILIFVDKHIEGDNLFKDLYSAGYRVLLLHGGQDQTDREFTISDFKNGVRNIMVATSLAARGLDIKTLVLVVNYSCPNHTEDYVHRVGRTGRAGNKGVAITFITPDECQYAGEIVKALKQSGTEIPEELETLDATYRQKVSKGEMEKYKANGFVGNAGYKFNQAEDRKLKQIRRQLSRSWGFEMEVSDSDSDVEVKDAKNKPKEEEEKPKEQIIAEKIKDPNIKQAAIDAAINAAKIAIVNGSDLEGIKKAAEIAISKVVEEYKPTVSLKEGLEKVLELRDNFESLEEEKNNRFSVDFEINDYPQCSKNKIQQKEFANHINEFFGCTMSIRGVNVEPNKKPPNGQRRLYIHIEGDTKQDVQNAHREIKRVLEDSARTAIEERGGYSNAPGRYSLP